MPSPVREFVTAPARLAGAGGCACAHSATAHIGAANASERNLTKCTSTRSLFAIALFLENRHVPADSVAFLHFHQFPVCGGGFLDVFRALDLQPAEEKVIPHQIVLSRADA